LHHPVDLILIYATELLGERRQKRLGERAITDGISKSFIQSPPIARLIEGHPRGMFGNLLNQRGGLGLISFYPTVAA
jgi:hypothetical protein